MPKRTKIPEFGKFLDKLQEAGVETETGRGFWGGVTPKDEIVVTAWIDQRDSHGRFKIHRPRTNHGNLKTAWELGNIQVGTEVRLILIRQRGEVRSDEPKQVGGAALMEGKWKVVKVESDGKSALVGAA